MGIELAMLAPFRLFICDLWDYCEFQNLTSLFQSGTEHVCHFLIFFFLQNHSLLLWILELSGSKFFRSSSQVPFSFCVCYVFVSWGSLAVWFWLSSNLKSSCLGLLNPGIVSVLWGRLRIEYCCFFCCSISRNLKKILTFLSLQS